ncbi:hypothetical protein [Lactobacillus koreensis] [Lactiplantibacillus mudanjiangensis]|nr:hypothetical protein [Lactobacillus koreensis] [Lactiplantibacillus mudanjiangensis]
MCIYVLLLFLCTYVFDFFFFFFLFFFFKQKTAYEIPLRLVGSEMCIRDRYNAYTGMIIGMPITSKLRNGPMYVPIADIASGIHGSIVTYQMPNFDFEGRHGKIIGHLQPKIVKDLLKRAKQIF